MNDHVSVSINQLPSSSSSPSSNSESESSNLPTQETSALLQPQDGGTANETSLRMSNVPDMSRLGGGMSRYLKIVMSNIIRRKEIESSETVEREALLPDVGPSNSSTGDTTAIQVPSDYAPQGTGVDGSRESVGNSIRQTLDKDHTIVNNTKEGKNYLAASKSSTESKKVILDSPDVPSIAECRICQEEDEILNLESPCACSGSLKYAHRKCIQHWCDEKGDTLCEICQKPFEGGYVSAQPVTPDSIEINIGTGWDIASGQPRLFALAADHHFLDAEYDEYAGAHAHSAACFRSVALMLVALLLLRHILSMTGADDEDASTFFLLSLVRAAGFLIPCYIMARAMNALQIRRQRQEAALAAAAAAAEVTYIIQAGQVQSVVSPGTSV